MQRVHEGCQQRCYNLRKPSTRSVFLSTMYEKVVDHNCQQVNRVSTKVVDVINGLIKRNTNICQHVNKLYIEVYKYTYNTYILGGSRTHSYTRARGCCFLRCERCVQDSILDIKKEIRTNAGKRNR